MSATLEESWLRTVDVEDIDLAGRLTLEPDDEAHPVVAKRIGAQKTTAPARARIGDVKDLANQSGPRGSFEGIGVYRRAEARFHPFPAASGHVEVAPVLGPGSGVSMAAGLIALDAAATTLTLQWDAALVALDDAFWLEAEGRRTRAARGDLFWLPQGTTATLGSHESACIGYVNAPVDWAERLAWAPEGPGRLRRA